MTRKHRFLFDSENSSSELSTTRATGPNFRVWGEVGGRHRYGKPLRKSRPPNEFRLASRGVAGRFAPDLVGHSVRNDVKPP